MKKILFTLTAIIAFGFITKAQNVNIPDANFKAYLVGNAAINTNSDTEIQVSEANAFSGSINCSLKNIASISGIESFTSLTELYLFQNAVLGMDLSYNTALEVLDCGNNDIMSLDLSSNTALTKLYCGQNNISSIDLFNQPNLTVLHCNWNNLTSLDLSNSNSLTEINCGLNSLTSLDISNLTSLEDLNCSANEISSIDFSTNTLLKSLSIGNNKITNLDLSSNVALEEIACSDNLLNEFDVANGNNIIISFFYAINNPNLTCIQVDDVAYSNTNWFSYIDTIASFNTNCGGVISVNTITVQGQGGVSTITTNGGTLQMEADVLPINADDATYTWSVTNGTGSATISATGLLTATSDGTVDVTATANDASGTTGTKTITISNQSVGINDIAFENISVYPNPTNGILNLEIEEEITSLKTMDISGRTIQVYNPNQSQIDISSFTTGVYFLGIANTKKKSVVKIIKK